MNRLKKIIATLLMATFAMSLLTGCKAEYKADSKFLYSSDKGHSYGDGTKDIYWDYYLNNNYLTTFNIEMLEKGKYYLGEYSDSGHYKTTVCRIALSDITIRDCIEKNTEENPTVVENTWTGYVGLLRVGEMFASQFKDGYLSSSSYWLITPNDTVYIFSVYPRNWISECHHLMSDNGARPTIHLKSNIVIKSGSGTKEEPFVVGLPS